MNARLGARLWAPALANAALLAAPLAAATGPPFPIARATVAPAIDGIGDPVWGESTLAFFGEDIYNVTFRALHDGRTLYLFFEDLTNAATPGHDEFWIYIDEEGGTPPQRWDGLWGLDACDVDYPEESEEGAWGWLNDEGFVIDERWRQVSQAGGTCADQTHLGFTRAAVFVESPEGPVHAEVAIPIEGTGTQEFGAGDEVGIYVEVYDDAFRAGLWPPLGGFARAQLAVLGCNEASGENFDPGFPLDWEVTDSSATSWLSTPDCGTANQTGGTGEAACVFKDEPKGAAASTLVSPWFSLARSSTATLSYRGVYTESSPDTSSDLGLEATTDGTNWDLLVAWGSDHNETVNVDLESYIGAPRVRLRWVLTTGNGVSTVAQVDDVRLACGPFLFSDGFETGLTTHWSADSP